ncbi:MAG: hypothetical protein GY820_20205, partial [Gammaproteobacteria bacterium]|nr:hypothetical protein [Gammaproteobacteria bacterium]
FSNFRYDQPIAGGGRFFGESAILRFLVLQMTEYFSTVIGWNEKRFFSLNRQLNVLLGDINFFSIMFTLPL